VFTCPARFWNSGIPSASQNPFTASIVVSSATVVSILANVPKVKGVDRFGDALWIKRLKRCA
jgi:hypothetical protein